MNRSTPGPPVHHQLPEFTQTHVHRVSDAIQPSHPLVPISSCPQSFPASGSFQMSQLFTSGGQCIGVPASKSVLPRNTQDWSPLKWTGLDLLAVQGTLKSLLQHHSSKASIFRCSAFYTVQLSHPYMTTGQTTALTRWTFVGKVMSLLFNMLSRLFITFLPRSKRLLILWLQSPSAVILEPRKIKSATVSTVSPSICHEVIYQNIIHQKFKSQIFLIIWMMLNIFACVNVPFVVLFLWNVHIICPSFYGYVGFIDLKVLFITFASINSFCLMWTAK